MRESSLVPCNVLNWPIHQNLLPDEKLLLLALWGAGWLDCSGTGVISIRGFAAELGLDPSALQRGLENLHSLGSIYWDREHNEILIRRWFAFHKFKNGIQTSNLLSAIKKINSKVIKNEIMNNDVVNNVILIKSDTCETKAKATEEDKSSSLHADAFKKNDSEDLFKETQKPNQQPTKKRKRVDNGVVIWDDDDVITLKNMIFAYGELEVSKAAREVAGKGKEALPSYVLNQLMTKNGVQNAQAKPNVTTLNKQRVADSAGSYYE